MVVGREIYAFLPDVVVASRVASHIRSTHFAETTVAFNEASTGEGYVAVLEGFPIEDVVREVTGVGPIRVVSLDELMEAPDRFGIRMLGDRDRPDDDSYGRVTHPERYQIVVDAALTILDELSTRYEVERTTGSCESDFPGWSGSPFATTRVVPREGAPLVVGVTDFPGVMVRAGEDLYEAFPWCGCDACDEQPLEVIERLRELVEAVVHGRFTESVERRTKSHRYWGEWGSSGTETPHERDERTSSRHTREWPTWPLRQGPVDIGE